VLWGTCDTGKPRVRILRDGLRANGVDLIECRADVWAGIEDKSQVRGRWRWLRLLAGIVSVYPRLVWRYLRLPAHDWVLLGYPAIPDVFVIRLFAWLRGARISMDWFLSAYDTVVLDRALVARRHPIAGLLWGIEWAAVRLANHVFMDTVAHARRMERLFNLPPNRCGAVWVGAEDVFFAKAMQPAPERSDEPLQVLFYGQFIPLHGVPTIIRAARILRNKPVDWRLIGGGQQAPLVRRMLESDPLPRLCWDEWVDYPALRGCIDMADVCLGIFGTSGKAASVIPNKVFQTLAAGKQVITRDSPAIRELDPQSLQQIVTVPADDPAALAAEIETRLHRDTVVVGAGGAAFRAEAIGRQWLASAGAGLR
jgi:glycosyltransferase involved in cell wall biosynthesis